MAVLFHRTKRYDEALELYQRALAGQEKALGKDDLDTLVTAHNMALLFDSTKRYDEALELYQIALAGREKVLGKDYSHILLTVNYMANTLENLGRHEEAIQLKKTKISSRNKTGNHMPDYHSIVFGIAVESHILHFLATDFDMPFSSSNRNGTIILDSRSQLCNEDVSGELSMVERTGRWNFGDG
ncbi:hypothetical protein RUND412_011064 [Rhizina undulata]